MQNRLAKYEPISMLCIYKSDQGRYYIEKADIVPKNGFYTGFKPISDHFVKTVFTNMDVNKDVVQFAGYIPANVIGYANQVRYNVVAWHTPPQIKQLRFIPATGYQSGKYGIPGLVWVFGDDLFLYAYKKWDGLKTELFSPPFLNVSKDGAVCLGSAGSYIANQKKMTFTSMMKAVEDGFFNSNFTHGGEANINGSFAEVYTKTFNKASFPSEVLKPLKITVKSVTDNIFNE